MKKLFVFLVALFEYLPAITTIVLAIYATSPGTISQDQLNNWIILLLALLATTTILDRLKYLNKITKIYSIAEAIAQDPIPADRFLKPGLPDLTSYLVKAKSIDICGVTINRSIQRYLNILEERLNSGCKIRAILIDPNSIAPEHAESKSRSTDARTYRSKIALTLHYLHELKKKTLSSSGTLSVRVVPFDPSFGMFIINGDDSDGIIACEIYQHSSNDPCPSFQLNAIDKNWFTFFRRQYSVMWEKGVPVDLDAQI
jgi:hypothetical protein